MDPADQFVRIGFTGTHLGMSVRQKALVEMHLLEQFKPEMNWLMHGDCIGADAEAASIARRVGYGIWVFPPINEYRRAFTIADRREDPADYIDRDRNIVDNCEILLVTPHTNYEMIRSGTWATYRYAKSLDRKIVLVYPFGMESDLL